MIWCYFDGCVLLLALSILVLYNVAGLQEETFLKWFKVDFLAATISEWDGLLYFQCKSTTMYGGKFTPSTTMYGGEMGVVWFWWAPCVRGLHFFSKTSCCDTWLHKWHPLHPTILLHSNPLPAATQYLLTFTISQQPRQGHLRSKLIVKVMEFLSNTNPWATVLCSTLHWKNSMWEFETTANLNSAQFWICTSFGSNFKYHSHVNSLWIQICLTYALFLHLLIRYSFCCKVQRNF